MAWRTVYLEKQTKLWLSRNNLHFYHDEEELSIPIEDIDTLIIDNHGTSLTTNLIDSLANQEVSIIICDSSHLPSTIITPYAKHSRQAKISRDQLNMKLPMKKQLWQINITRKILNQAAVLKYFGLDNTELIKLSKLVKSGDTSNCEAVAARLYFDQLLSDSTRRQPTWCNSALDYGYSIVRSAIARSVASHGLISSLGIFHHNELNNFNLVDDLIECYRPFVDLFVMELFYQKLFNDETEYFLSKDDRYKLIQVINEAVSIRNLKYSIKNSTDIVVESFIASFQAENIELFELPKLIS
jgi:CRISPR-associated endonuclease cas1, NMENI subtype